MNPTKVAIVAEVTVTPEAAVAPEVTIQEEVTMSQVTKSQAEQSLSISERLALRIAAARQEAAIKAEAAAAAKLNAPAKVVAGPKLMPLCACGCNVRTGGGVYRPGHDAKHKSALFAAIDRGDEEALALCEAKGWLHLKAMPKAVKPERVTRRTVDEWADESARAMAKVMAESDLFLAVVNS